MTTRLIFFLTCFAIVMALSIWKGGAPERIASAIIVYGLLSTIALQGPIESRFLSMELGVFIVDVSMLVLFFVLALFAERFWPIWMSGFQIIQALSHLAQILIPHMLPQAYKTIVTVWAYPMLIILAWATVRHRERVLTLGSDKSWSDFSLA
jgi:hypothetical protein